jgi:hypothetical protein
VVRELFGRYTKEHASIADLARWLTDQQLPTRTGKARWDRSTVGGCCATRPTPAGPPSPRPCAPSSARG